MLFNRDTSKCFDKDITEYLDKHHNKCIYKYKTKLINKHENKCIDKYKTKYIKKYILIDKYKDALLHQEVHPYRQAQRCTCTWFCTCLFVFVLVDELGFVLIDALVVVLVQILCNVLVKALVSKADCQTQTLQVVHLIQVTVQ